MRVGPMTPPQPAPLAPLPRSLPGLQVRRSLQVGLTSWEGLPFRRSGAAERLVNAAGRWRARRQLARRATRPRYKFSPAVRARPLEPDVGALRTERTLERADPSVARVRGKVPVAALAPRTELQHAGIVPRLGNAGHSHTCQTRNLVPWKQDDLNILRCFLVQGP